MRAVVQRVKASSVKVNGKIIGNINKGMNVLVGFTHDDNELIVDKMVDKLIKLRIFDGENLGEKSIQDINGEILLISQFTLYGSLKKGNRPSYIDALKSNDAVKLYDYMYDKLKDIVHTEKGKFGADMEVSIVNDGPMTFCIEI